MMKEKVKRAQECLQKDDLNGWLLYDFRHNNELAHNFLEISPSTFVTRRFLYWIPETGEPIRIVSAIEPHTLDHLPGKTILYRTWQEFQKSISEVLKGIKKIVMEYSPNNAIPTLSKVDAGTIEFIRGLGVEILSSGDLLQQFTSVLDEEKVRLHLEAANVLEKTVDQVWEKIASSLKNKEKITEYDVQQWILNCFKNENCITEGEPICAVNANSANPHYTPSQSKASLINSGDFILIDLWCKKDQPHATFADITRVGVADSKPTKKQSEIFDIVKQARDAATNLVIERMKEGKPLLGWEVDQASRQIIQNSGYGEYFIHRTGHNIDDQDHGSGANIDSYETQDTRQIIPGTCFSIEPGIYLPDAFGIRLEYNVLISLQREVQVTGGIQNELKCLL